MKRIAVLALVGAVVVLGIVLSQSLAQQAVPAKVGVPRTAVCDVAQVFREYARRPDVINSVNEKKKAAAAQDQVLLNKLQQMDKTLAELKPGSKEHEARLDEMERLALERKNWGEHMELTLAREQGRLMEEMYREIIAAIAQVAQRQGYDLVMYRDVIELSSQNNAELMNKITLRKCLYANPAIDLTTQVLDEVNSQYRKVSGKK